MTNKVGLCFKGCHSTNMQVMKSWLHFLFFTAPCNSSYQKPKFVRNTAYPQKSSDHESQESGQRFDFINPFELWILWIRQPFWNSVKEGGKILSENEKPKSSKKGLDSHSLKRKKRAEKKSCCSLHLKVYTYLSIWDNLGHV